MYNQQLKKSYHKKRIDQRILLAVALATLCILVALVAIVGYLGYKIDTLGKVQQTMHTDQQQLVVNTQAIKESTNNIGIVLIFLS